MAAAAPLPAGTVTFLFTDIEGSTRLLHELGPEEYSEALASHRRVVRAACERQDGVEVDTQGDAFFVAFPTAHGALEAAREAQATLEIPVRMGIHTGAPLLTSEGYVGHDVHKAARIASAGHGRQILVSAASAALVEADGLRDLGEHRLKDLSAPERIFQLGDGEFPPLKTLYRTNLPVPATSFLGRERELAELEVFLAQEDTRLLTLLGPGGTGKTRLALQAAAAVADNYPDGVFWLALAPLSDPKLVLELASKAVGSKNGLAEHIADKRLLLLLDNFEHLIEAASELAPLLAGCPNLTLVVTSRELLQLAGEQSYPVAPLEPEDGVELFTARANAVALGFEADEAVPAICARLDNLPLALELAAARVRVLSPTQLLERLTERLDLLKGGRDADPRQQTLRATIEWSHDLLEPEEQELLARLAIFRGGCTLEAAEAVAGANIDTLQSLVDKSLVRQNEERFWMLETIREYARERLAASGEEAELVRRHVDWYLAFVEEIDSGLDEGGDDVRNFARIGAEHENLRAALEWARDVGEDELLLRLAAALANYWDTRAFFQEMDMWLALALERGSFPAAARIKALNWASNRAHARHELAPAEALIHEWRTLAEQEGDEPEALNAMINSAGITGFERGDYANARAQFTAIAERARDIGAGRTYAGAIINLGVLAHRNGDFQIALDHSLTAADLFRELGRDFEVASATGNCGWHCLGLGEPARAEKFFTESVALFGRLGAIRMVTSCLEGLAAALVAGNDEHRGAQLLGAAASLREELGVGFFDEEELEINDRAVADAQAALGEEAFAETWARGEAMTTEEILAFTMPS
jgi:predicted ATPase/class 3 adenylate cyclase